MIAYKVSYDGSSYIETNLSNLVDMLETMDVDISYQISKIEISEKDYNNLPEFTGF